MHSIRIFLASGWSPRKPALRKSSGHCSAFAPRDKIAGPMGRSGFPAFGMPANSPFRARVEMKRSFPIRSICLLLALALGQAGVAPAQETKPTPDEPKGGSPAPEAGSTPEQRQIRELLQRLEKVETELSRMKAANGQLPTEKKDQKLLTLLESPFLGHHYYNNPGRFFAAKLIFINLTPQPIVLKKGQFQVEIDGVASPLKDVPQQLQYMSFQAGAESMQLRNLTTPAELKVPSGGTASTWIVYAEIAAGNQVPKIIIRAGEGSSKVEVDVNQYALGVLGLDIERIGPRQSLGLLTINGNLNTINAGGLVDAVDKLVQTHKTARTVIRWSDSGAPLDPQCMQWLVQSSQMAGRGELQNQQFPSFPATVRELHLAKIPNSNVDPNNYGVQQGMAQRIHKTDAEAVTAALITAYEVLPIDELVNEIERGHPLTRAAALAGGGGRLPSEKLSILLKYADDSNPAMQRGALIALRHFGESDAIQKLEQHALRNTEPLGTTALESLASSRFPAAHAALLKILKNEAAPARKKIVAVLAQNPRPAWSETIYEFVQDPNSGLGAEGLKALSLVGHPKLVEVFTKALADKNVEMRNEAFNLLSQRVDPESEELAMKFTLDHLKNAPPTGAMTNLLNRTKDRRALPLLMALFEKQPSNRAALIGTLASLGDETVTAVFVQEYPKLRTNEQMQVLNALMQLKSPEFRKLAGQALMSSDASLVNTASNLLQSDGGPEAVKMLVEAFDKSTNVNTWSNVTNALGNAGTPEAREALLKGRASSDQNKRNMANNALRNLWQRSPGYQYIYQGQQYTREEKWKEAVDQYKLAIDTDPELPDAWAGRANALLKQSEKIEDEEKKKEALKDARTDFEKANALDPWNSIAVTGLGILLSIEGKYEEGIKRVEEARAKFPNDNLFAYNTACVYSQASEAVGKDEKAADRDKKKSDYQQKAIEELKRAMQLGFGDLEWMKKDPDLVPLHDLDAFKEVAKPDPNAKPRKARKG